MKRRIVLALSVAACSAPGPAPRSPNPGSTAGVVRVDTIARALSHPWGIAVMPDGRLLVTERIGFLRVIDTGGAMSAPIGGVPEVFSQGQGGLLDVALDPAFATNRVIYLSYAEPGAGGTAGTAVARARLGNSTLDSVKVIYRQEPKVIGGGHFGSRIVFAKDGTMFVTQGERFTYRDKAQDLSTDLGKVVRINSDGTVPRDNPFVGRPNVRPEIWSYGHRNVQAAALDPESGQLWTIEHGAAGGDELNHPEAGRNYGWPVITYGRDYNGRKIGEGTAKAGMEQPVYYWDPVIAPSGMTFYSGRLFSSWAGNILVGGLASNTLVRLVLQNGTVLKEERYLHELHERIRDVQEAPDGSLYIITDSDNGRIFRVLPAR